MSDSGHAPLTHPLALHLHIQLGTKGYLEVLKCVECHFPNISRYRHNLTAERLAR